MVGDRVTFEVQVSRGGRWEVDTMLRNEEEARAHARKLFANKRCEGVRILRNWTRGDGIISETEIFTETRTVKDEGPIRVAVIESAPEKCATNEAFLGSDSRGTIGRLLHEYLEKVFLTPTELLHSHKEMKRLQDKDTLVPTAVDRVAALQCRSGEQDPRARGQEIHRALDELAARARRAETTALPALEGRFSDVLARLKAMGGGEDPEYLAMVVLSRDLMNARNWVGKLERLCRLAVEDSDPHAIGMLDGVIADLLGASLVQDILGAQPNLAAAIIAMFDLSEGRMDVGRSQVGPSAETLNALFAGCKLPISRATLLDRAHRQIRSGSPLSRNDSTREDESYRRLVARVVGQDGFLCGVETAEALTTRQTRMTEQGGAIGRRTALLATFRAMPDRATGLVYLCEMARSSFIPEHASDIVAMLDHVTICRRIVDLCDHALPPRERMARTTRAHAAVMASPFPATIKARVANALDSILERYLLDEQIIEKLDNPNSPLRERATRLVQFCAAGVLPQGRALSLARERVLSLLRQPSFDAHFIDGFADAQMAQKALRDFYALLVRAGLGG
jgi:hypothetical protein